MVHQMFVCVAVCVCVITVETPVPCFVLVSTDVTADVDDIIGGDRRVHEDRGFV